MSEKKYPIGGYAPGSYQCHCATCGGGFTGDKRSFQCEPCALNDKAKFDALSLTEQEELIKKNAAAIQEAFKDWGKKPDITPAIIGQGPVKSEIKQPSAVWVKASSKLPGFDGQVHLKIDGLNRIGNLYHEEGKNKLYVQGPEPYILYEDKFGGVEWLDESGTARESPAEQPVVLTQERADLIREVNGRDLEGLATKGREESDAVEFAEWILKHKYYPIEHHERMWSGASIGSKLFTTGQLYQLFKQRPAGSGEKEKQRTIEFCYRDSDDGVQVRYRRIQGTPECDAMIAEVEKLIEKAKPGISPYFYRVEGEKEVKP